VIERKLYKKLTQLYRKAKPNLKGIVLEYLVFKLYKKGYSGDENLRRIRYRGLYRRFYNDYVLGRDRA
jgi:hypothetical protein